MTVRIEAPMGLFQDDQQEQDWFFSIYRKLTDDLRTKTFTNFSPTLSASGSMTVSNSNILFARYAAIGELVFIEFNATFTIGGTPDLSINFDLPLKSNGDFFLPAVVKDGGNELSGMALTSADSKTLRTRRYDASNWNTGGNREIRISGYYRTTETY